MQQNLNNNDYCGFSRFKDNLNFKYSNNGDICISNDCSTWSKVLINNMKLDDYFQCENTLPSYRLLLPNFGTKKKIKKGKETFDDYIDVCDLCNFKLGIDRYICYKNIICFECMNIIKLERCVHCKKNHNMFIEKYINKIITYKNNIWIYIEGGNDYFSLIGDYFCKNCFYEEVNRCMNCGNYSGNESLCSECEIWG